MAPKRKIIKSTWREEEEGIILKFVVEHKLHYELHSLNPYTKIFDTKKIKREPITLRDRFRDYIVPNLKKGKYIGEYINQKEADKIINSYQSTGRRRAKQKDDETARSTSPQPSTSAGSTCAQEEKQRAQGAVSRRARRLEVELRPTPIHESRRHRGQPPAENSSDDERSPPPQPKSAGTCAFQNESRRHRGQSPSLPSTSAGSTCAPNRHLEASNKENDVNMRTAQISAQLCKDVAEQLTKAADNAVTLYNRLADKSSSTNEGFTSSEDKLSLIKLLEHSVTKTQSVLNEVSVQSQQNASSCQNNGSENPDSVKKINDLAMTELGCDIGDIIKFMNTYSDILLNMMQEKMSNVNK